jgi:hypothetical protein
LFGIQAKPIIYPVCLLFGPALGLEFGMNSLMNSEYQSEDFGEYAPFPD